MGSDLLARGLTACRASAHSRSAGLVAGVAFHALYLGFHAWCITGHGLWGLGWAWPFTLTLALAVMVATLVTATLLGAAVVVSVRRSARARHSWSAVRHACVRHLLLVTPLLVLAAPSWQLADRLHEHGFALAHRRAEPLIAALQRHARDRGAPPRSLHELVPTWLAALPEGLPPVHLAWWGEPGGPAPRWQLHMPACWAGWLESDWYQFDPQSGRWSYWLDGRFRHWCD